MKIVSWNCNGKFREKFQYITKLKADIYVIQECENPTDFQGSDYFDFAKNYVWSGDYKNKGLCVFATPDIEIIKNNWESYCLRNFLSVKVNSDFDLLAVWACDPYIKEYYVYQSVNIDKYNDNTIIIGDFNSNAEWDKRSEKRSHMNVVNELNDKGLCSAYHYIHNEEQGKESAKTFYMYRHLDKGYHIDHCFIRKERINWYEVLNSSEWLKYSDHMPIVLNIFDSSNQL